MPTDTALIQALYDPSPESEIRTGADGIPMVWYDGQPITPLGKKKALPDEYCHPEPGYNIGRCRMLKSDGPRCANPVREGWTVCRYHGAGYAAKSGGAGDERVSRHGKFLPARYVERFEQFMIDPDALALYSELALLDSRTTELAERLDSCDSKEAWAKVSRATYMLGKLTHLDEDVPKIVTLLQEAQAMKADEQAIWREMTSMVEIRRRVADTEQKREIAAKQYLSIPEANAMLAFIMDIIIQHVTDQTTREKIAEKMRGLMRE